MSARRLLAAIVALLLASGGAIAQKSTNVAAPPDSHSGHRVISHGEQLRYGDVGPAAAGIKVPAAPYAGTEIRDGRSYSFAREIAATAHYDGFEVAGPHLLIEGARFDGPLDIYASKPIVLRGVSVRTSKAAYWAIHTRPGAGAIYILWSDIGAASTEGAPKDRSRALDRALYLRADKSTVYRSHISRTADGIQLHARGALITETLIDDLTYWEKDHNDGIQMLGRGAEAVITRSRVINRNNQTSCLNLIGDHVRVEDNYLAGGGWVIYGGADNNGRGQGFTKKVIVRGNVFGRSHFPKSGYFGPVTYWDRAPGAGNVWQRNRYDDGRKIEP